MENVWGSKSFTLYYFICVIGAGLVQLFVVTQGARQGGVYPTIGASGGVFGLLLERAAQYYSQGNRAAAFSM